MSKDYRKVVDLALLIKLVVKSKISSRLIELQYIVGPVPCYLSVLPYQSHLPFTLFFVLLEDHRELLFHFIPDRGPSCQNRRFWGPK